MSRFLPLLKSLLVTGLIIVLPVWLAILIALQILMKLGVIVKPLAGWLPKGAAHPALIGLFLFLLVCILIGLLFHTSLGKTLGHAIEDTVLDRIPGYTRLRSVANQLQDFQRQEGFKPVFIEVEDGCLSPAFLIERHAQDRCTVFLPSSPTPFAGNILIMPGERVHPVDVSVPAMMACITKWGDGAGALMASLGTLEPSRNEPAP